MASNPKARIGTVHLSKGTASATIGLLEYLFGADFEWRDPRQGASTPGGRRRRAYGTRLRTGARGGRVMFLRLVDGDVFTIRYTGAAMDLVGELLIKAKGKIEQAWTERGTLYGPSPDPN